MTRQHALDTLNHIKMALVTDKKGDKDLLQELRVVEILLSINKFDKPVPGDNSRHRIVVPLFVDDYTGPRCTFCGGELRNGSCINNSAEWPHPPESRSSDPA